MPVIASEAKQSPRVWRLLRFARNDNGGWPRAASAFRAEARSWLILSLSPGG
jgi:hypothetical protein